MAINWTCPHCNSRQTVGEQRLKKVVSHFGLYDQIEGPLTLEKTATGCVNPECEKTSLRVRIGNALSYTNGGGHYIDEDKIVFDQWLIPQGSAKPQPDFIPQAIRDDYYEACLIRDLSPKASATLIRRCLQGMIRDFAKIIKPTLFAEIEALRASVVDGSADRAISSESVDAIDHVRGIGNIGAHMEKDIDLLIEVDPGEAQALIGLVEMLFEEWYGARQRRQSKLAHIAKIADNKKLAKNGGHAAQPTSEAVPKSNALFGDPSTLQAAMAQSLSPVKGSNALLEAQGIKLDVDEDNADLPARDK